MRETYLEVYELVNTFLQLIFFYYTIYEVYKIGHAFSVKKNAIEVAKTNKTGFLAIISFIIAVSCWLYWGNFTEKSLTETPFNAKSPSEWSSELSKKELEDSSKMHAKYAFIYSGKGSLYYEAKLNEWNQFAPTDADIKKHDENLIQIEQIKYQAHSINQYLFMVATIWLTVGLIGWHSGRNSK
jgi:hypothetical protein